MHRLTALLPWLTVLIGAGLASPTAAQLTFSEVAVASGFSQYNVPNRGFGAGLSAADFDDDGDIDFFVSTGLGEPDLLFRNVGDGTFDEVAAALGVAGMLRSRSALWFDYDGDGRLDLLVGGDCYERDCDEAISLVRLYRQKVDGTFEDVTSGSGLEDLDTGRETDDHRMGFAAGDIDNDGDLDLVSGYWLGTLHLHRNNGDGTFTDISAAAGFDDQQLGHHQAVVQDFDGDGWVDIYISVDFGPNRLWENQGLVGGMPTFTDIAPAADCDNAMNDMGVALGDYDDDGDPDFYVTNIFRLGFHNVLQRNDVSEGGSVVCTEGAEAAGVDDGGWGWGATFFDADLDGDLDLAETNGWRNNGWEVPVRLWLRQPGAAVTFVDTAASAGLTSDLWGSTLVAIDVDRDGDLDLAETKQTDRPEAIVYLYENQLSAVDRHYLTVRPRSTGTNSHAIGAKITAEVGSTTMTRWITAGISYLGQEPAEAFFGLGSETVVDRLTVSWPGGGETVLDNVYADRMLTISDSLLHADGFNGGTTDSWDVVVP